LISRLGERQNQSEEEKNLLLVGIEPRFFDRLVRSLDQGFSNCSTTAIVSYFAALLQNINIREGEDFKNVLDTLFGNNRSAGNVT